MGKEKTTQETRPEATPEERELSRLEMERTRAVQPGLIRTQERGLDLVSQLLAGEDLPGYLGELPGGISPEMTTEMAKRSISDLPAFFQTQGLLDSGVAPEIMSKVAGETRMGAAQFNIQNLMQLLNLAVGGQAQVQQPIMTQQGLLSQRLAGLRPVTTTTTGMNPFLKSLQTSAGQSLGGWAKRPSFSVGPMTFGEGG